jgi:AP-3 complex subunit delta-1
MFETTLADLVTGIRSHKRDTALFISQSIADIKVELQSSDLFVKSNALQKLTFLQMMGYSMSWAIFAAVEVMSSTRFALKRVGVLGICQGLDSPDRSPVVLLTTNMIKKELRGATVATGSRGGENIYHAGLAINCLSNIVTEDLGRETLTDLVHLLRHPSPYVRKKALLCLYKVFLKYPQGLRLSYDAIKSCLDDAHPSVVSCAVNVITELSDKNPKNYLPLAPAFFRLLTSSANNWMLIKVVKLLGSLVPEEPRLARKLLEPLSNIVKSTHAKSLLYEAVYAITLCLQYVNMGRKETTASNNASEIVDLCVDTLRSFVSDPDQNLKYLGLVGFGSLLQSQPRVLLSSRTECRSLILKCLSDEDVTIRTRALGLLRFMTTSRNLVDLITQLLGHVEAASGEYRSDLVREIVRMCSSDKYELVSDFAWYFDVLLILASVRGVGGQGDAIARQWMDVAWRVLPVRAYAVRRSLEVLVCRGPGGIGGGGGADGNDGHIMPEVLPAAAWIVGEYSHQIPDALTTINDGARSDPRYDAKSAGPYHALVQSMTSPLDAAGIDPLPASTQAVFVQNAMKVFAAACERNRRTHREVGDGIPTDNDVGLACSDDELLACAITLMGNLVVYSESPDVEVKERAFTSRQLLLAVGIPPDVSLPTATTDPSSIASKCRDASSMLTYLLTPEPMKPISAKAQQRKLSEGPPSPLSVEEWDRGVDWDVFPFLMEETPWFDGRGNVRGSVESISFTKQQTSNANTSSKGRFDGCADAESFVGAAIGNAYLDPAISARTNVPPSSSPKLADPFYLSAPAAPTGRLLDTSGGIGIGDVAKDAADAAAVTRFGSIQLDSEGESDDGYDEAKSKKKKKKKKAGKVMVSKPQKIVESDDEDDDNNQLRPKRGLSKEIHNLALVDLTTPLGEDDVMPRNEHYVVPERPVAEAKSSPKKSKKKKDKTSKKKKSHHEPTSLEGDLLGFDSMAFRSTLTPVKPENPTASAAVAVPSCSNNPIHDAFDDLLGLNMPQLLDSSNAVAQMGDEVELATPNEEKKQKKDKQRKKSKKKE